MQADLVQIADQLVYEQSLHYLLRHLLCLLKSLQAVIAKAKKLPKQQPGFKAEMEAFEEKLLTIAAERKEEDATAQVLFLEKLRCLQVEKIGN